MELGKGRRRFLQPGSDGTLRLVRTGRRARIGQSAGMKTRTHRASTAEIVRFLRNPRHYREPARHVEVIETHFAWVFLVGSYAYKLKKPVSRGHMDYRTVAARKQACCDEVILNSRLASRTYLQAMPIRRARDGTLALDPAGPGRIVDWVVKMRRLPADRMLDRAIVERRVRKNDLQAVVAALTKFFDTAIRQPMRADRYIEHLRRRILENQSDLCSPDLGLDSRFVTRITGMQLAFLAEHQWVVGARAGYLIDGHGDLRPEHVYLGRLSGTDGPCVIDCLEFDADLRWLDPAEEMAFLALECQVLGARDVARTLLSLYGACTLTPAGDELMDFYASQGALTRAKLAAWHLRDPAIAQHAAVWRSRARRYLFMAARYMRHANRQTPNTLGPAECSSAGERRLHPHKCSVALGHTELS